MTREEFMAKTNIKNSEEAKRYLFGIRLMGTLTIVALVLVFIGIEFDWNAQAILLPLEILVVVLLVSSQIYNYKVMMALGYTKSEAYRRLTSFNRLQNSAESFKVTNALKVIIGTRDASESLTPEFYRLMMSDRKELFLNKLFLKHFLIAILFGLALFIAVGVALNYGLL